MHRSTNRDRIDRDGILDYASVTDALAVCPEMSNVTELTRNDIIFYGVYYSILSCVSVIIICGNSMVILAILRHTSLRVPTNGFILSLSVSDLLNGFAYTTYQVSHIDIPAMTNTLGVWRACSVVLFAVTVLLMTSSYSLVGETVIRYMAVTQPLTFRHRIHWRHIAVTVVSMWVACFVINYALHFRKSPDHYKNMCRYEMIMSVASISGMFLIWVIIPLVLMTVMYIKIGYILRYKCGHHGVVKMMSKRLSQEESSTSFSSVVSIVSTEQPPTTRASHRSMAGVQITKQELKFVATAATLLGYYACVWLPFVLFTYISITCKTCDISRYIRAIVRLLLLSNSACNVFIYAGRNREFRRVFHEDLQRIVRCLRNCRRS